MPKVKIQKELNMKAEKLFKTVEDILTNDKEIKALEPHLSFDSETADGEIKGRVKGSRVNGDFFIKQLDEVKSSIVIDLTLPLILTPFKSIVEKKINDKLNAIG